MSPHALSPHSSCCPQYVCRNEKDQASMQLIFSHQCCATLQQALAESQLCICTPQPLNPRDSLFACKQGLAGYLPPLYQAQHVLPHAGTCTPPCPPCPTCIPVPAGRGSPAARRPAACAAGAGSVPRGAWAVMGFACPCAVRTAGAATGTGSIRGWSQPGGAKPQPAPAQNQGGCLLGLSAVCECWSSLSLYPGLHLPIICLTCSCVPGQRISLSLMQARCIWWHETLL